VISVFLFYTRAELKTQKADENKGNRPSQTWGFCGLWNCNSCQNVNTHDLDYNFWLIQYARNFEKIRMCAERCNHPCRPVSLFWLQIRSVQVNSTHDYWYEALTERFTAHCLHFSLKLDVCIPQLPSWLFTKANAECL